MMRNISKILLAATAVVSIGLQQAEASLIGVPHALRGAIQRIKFDAPTLAPMAYTLFCLKYADECKSQRRMVFRGGRVKLTAERWVELKSANRDVNAAIRPEPNTEGLAGEKWIIGPSSGDCNDYAVTKRHALIAKGWSSRSVLLSEVVIPSGEHHLVVVVRTNIGDLVLDNLTANITPWQRKAYKWVRIQMPNNPNYWSSLTERNV